MNYVVIVIILIISAFCGNYLYYKTDVVNFIIDKLKINTKMKCLFIDFVAIIFGIQAISSVLITYKNILSDVGLFMAVLIIELSDYTMRELKYYNKGDIDEK